MPPHNFGPNKISCGFSNQTALAAACSDHLTPIRPLRAFTPGGVWNARVVQVLLDDLLRRKPGGPVHPGGKLRAAGPPLKPGFFAFLLVYLLQLAKISVLIVNLELTM